jgi:hypothetical protein
MQMMDRNDDVSALIQEKWAEGFGLQVEGIVHATGAIVLCECNKVRSGSGLPMEVSILGQSRVFEVLAENKDPWVQITECDSLILDSRNLRLSCGEGAMGNEGYVAVCDGITSQLIWFAFFTCSNPFSEIRFEEGALIVETSYEQEWSFPLDAPQALSIRPTM